MVYPLLQGTVLTLSDLKYGYMIFETYKYTKCGKMHRNFSVTAGGTYIAFVFRGGCYDEIDGSVSDLGQQKVVKAYYKLLSRCLYRRIEED